MQIFGTSGNVFLHQGEPDALRDTAIDLAFDQARIDRAADIVRVNDAAKFHRPELHIDLQIGNLRGESIGGVGLALTVLVQGPGWRIEMAFAA